MEKFKEPLSLIVENPHMTSADPATPRPPPSASTPTDKRVSFPPSASHPPTPTTPAFSSTPEVTSSLPTSSRPAPPSPAMSRRASALVRSASTSSRASQTHSPHHSQSRRTSHVLSAARHRLSQSVHADDDEEEIQKEKAPIMIRDFAFPSADPRHTGLGPDVPPPCDPRRLARKLRPRSTSSNSSLDLCEDVREDGDADGEGEEGWGAGAFLGRLRLGGGSQAWTPSAADVDGVGAADFARNFADNTSDSYYSPPMDEETEIRPGLYRAQYAFQPEDDAEMELVEGQVVYVLGSAGSGGEGGGGGWAVALCREPVVIPPLSPSASGEKVGSRQEGEEEPVIALSRLVGPRTDVARVWEEWWAAAAGLTPPPHKTLTNGSAPQERRALVPDSFLVLIRGEGESEPDAKDRLDRWAEWIRSEREREEQGELDSEEGA